MTWQAFYTPHTDDETIGMAGAILAAKALGHDVLVTLVTDNLPSPRAFSVFPDVQDLREERRVEWRKAMAVLGVDELQMWEIPETLLTLTPFKMQAAIEERMRDVHYSLRPTMHHTVWGLNDVHIESNKGSLVHGLCANALVRVAMSECDVRAALYAVYEFAKPMSMRRAPSINTMAEDEFMLKRQALECYKEGNGSIGYGYKSVPELIDHAMGDPHEYVMEIIS